uniref:Fork-head domain-containing protein n=1 Tax=Macrostomum lignano TaxID=282301 RepID=A0A1I8JRA6_9PLAT
FSDKSDKLVLPTCTEDLIATFPLLQLQKILLTMTLDDDCIEYDADYGAGQRETDDDLDLPGVSNAAAGRSASMTSTNRLSRRRRWLRRPETAAAAAQPARSEATTRNRKLTLSGICEFIMNRFPYYKERRADVVLLATVEGRMCACAAGDCRRADVVLLATVEGADVVLLATVEGAMLCWLDCRSDLADCRRADVVLWTLGGLCERRGGCCAVGDVEGADIPGLAEQHRHNLSLKRLLRKNPSRAGQPGQGQLLDAGPQSEDMFDNGSFLRRREALQATVHGAPICLARRRVFCGPPPQLPPFGLHHHITSISISICKHHHLPLPPPPPPPQCRFTCRHLRLAAAARAAEPPASAVQELPFEFSGRGNRSNSGRLMLPRRSRLPASDPTAATAPAGWAAVRLRDLPEADAADCWSAAAPPSWIR